MENVLRWEVLNLLGFDGCIDQTGEHEKNDDLVGIHTVYRRYIQLVRLRRVCSVV